MPFPFHCFKSAPCAFHIVEIFYFVEILSEMKPETIKSKND